MTESQVERLAEDVLDAHGLHQLPVDPLMVARLERIHVAPGDYRRSFQARIEYRVNGDDGRFYLLYPDFDTPHPSARLRFSLAHELGHFFIPDHRRYLVSGQWRGNRTTFVAVRRLEREANWFAAAFLMPRDAFTDCVRRHGSDPFVLSDLANIARSLFNTSLTATARRYIDLNFHPCCVVVSDLSGLQFCVLSDEMKQRGYWSINGIPSESITGRLATSGSLRHSGVTGCEVWFPNCTRGDLWEEVCDLGAHGRMLTHLALLDAR